MSKAAWIIGFASFLLSSIPAVAQVSSDNSTGTIVAPNGNVFEITGGTAVGGRNLFHSFDRFDVPIGGEASFLNDPGIVNVFSRVTGGKVSEIDGVLRSSGTANLFLMNPSGIVFGQNASLDVGGSFVATTANGIQFGDRGSFGTSASSPVDVLTIDPSAFLFGQNPSAIVNQSIAPARQDPSEPVGIFGLKVKEGSSLLMLGGDIDTNGGGIVAFGGRVEIVAISAPGVVGLTTSGKELRLNIPENLPRGDITHRNNAGFIVAGDGGGSITLTARNINFSQGSSLTAGIGGNLGSVNSQGGNITVDASESLTLSGSFILNNIFSNASGATGEIDIFAGSMFVSDGGQIVSDIFGNGTAGKIAINVRDSIFMSETDKDTQISSSILSGANARTGGVHITTGSMFITAGSAIFSSVGEGGKGDVGGVRITAADIFSIDGEQQGNTSTTGFFPSAIFSRIDEGGEGNSDGIQITAGSLSITNRAQISSTTQGLGNAGNVVLDVSGQTLLLNSLIISEVAEDLGVGEGGDISITTGSLILRDGSALLADTEFRGNAGNIIINARDGVILDGRGPRALNREVIIPSQISTTVESNAIGEGGTIDIIASFVLMDDAFVSSGTSGEGTAGDIKITTDTLTMTGGAQILADTAGSRSAGSIIINATGSTAISGADADGFPSGIFASTRSGSTGNGGDVTFQTRSLSVLDSALISTQSFGSGNAGGINIRAIDRLNMNNSAIRTSAESSSGGAISISAGKVRLSGDSEITSSVQSGASGGGDIRIDADYILTRDDSDILAFSRDGQGGNITLSRAFFGIGYEPTSLQSEPTALRGNGRPDINATGQVSSGTVTTPDTSFIQNSLSQLSQSAIDTNALLANSCIVRNEQNGTFFITGTGGLPTNPGDLSIYSTGTVQPVRSNWKQGDAIVEPQGVYQLPNGSLVLSRECS